jgi:putative heme-binding domain-containing protein
MTLNLFRSPRRLLFGCGLIALAVPLVILILRAAPLQSADEAQPAVQLVLRPGEHISLIGNTLADRMQHDGWLETYLQSRFPKHQLTIRNLGFSGDEITLRLRSANFGSPDSWLKRNDTDTVFAFFGYNESFAGKEGLDQFKKDLANLITHTQSQKYNGKRNARIVLFSPIAHEDLHSPNLPDGSKNNARLALYTDAMAQVAKAHKVPFVDLFRPTRALYAKSNKPLTINGIHLTSEGNRAVAAIIDEALFPGKPAGDRGEKGLAALRKAVREKNYYWFQRYRTVDGYSIYGGRADLRFEEYEAKGKKINKKINTNREVAQREMEVLDVMTANRDRLVWAAAQGKPYTVDDHNTPPFVSIKTNKPGDGPGGAHLYLDPEKAIDKMKVGKGMKVNLFASEKDFPELVNPVQMSFDPQGRLWVAVWPTYPHWKPKEAMNDKILILEDTKGTGRADKCTVFADGLHCPTGFEFWNGGLLVAQAPDLMFLKDTKGTGKADLRMRVLSGLDSADTHHTSNSFVLDPGGGLYFQEGTFHHTQVETPYGPPVRCANAGVFRYEPRTQKFDVYVTYGFANPHGHVFDRWGQDIVIDGTGANPYHAALFSGRLPFPQKHHGPPQVYNTKGMRPCPGMEILSSRHFPPEMQGNLLVANVIGFHGIRRVKLSDDGASFTGTDEEPILSSSDENFRPSDLRVGPDGALYVLDWQNPIIGHMQHNLRDPSRGKTHGRIYRVTYPSRELLKPVQVAGEPIEKLLERLEEPEDRVAYRARLELTGRPSDKVIAAVKKWLAGLDKTAANYEHSLLNGLWQHQSHNVVDADLLKQVLQAKDFRARAAATRVLSYWHDRIPDALALLRKLAADEHPRVRLEAVRAASFFTEPEAIEVIPISQTKKSDRYIEFVRGETLRALQPYVAKAIAKGQKLKMTTPAGMRYILRTVSTDDLMKMERNQGVFVELLFRKGVRDEFRREALSALAKLEKKSELRVLLDAIRVHDAEETNQDESVAFDLIRLLTSKPASELAGVRADIEKLATSAKQPVTRQLGFVTLIAADSGIDKSWTLAAKSLRSLQDLVNAMPMIRDPGQRTALYPKVAALLTGLPKELAPGGAGKSLSGRYVRIELPGRQRTLTLAEVEVFSDGVNIARRGKASQKNTAHGGDASRAIDGNTSGNYNSGGQTHTLEGTSNPWWEVDLGSEQPIETIIIWNRTDGNLGSRLNGFTLKVLDAGRNAVFVKTSNPAPAQKVSFNVGAQSPERSIRRAAMTALPSVRGQETETVKSLAKFLKDGADRHVAVQALQRIPARLWPTDQARPVLDDLLAYVRKVPVKDRTTPAAVDALQLADTLAGLLPVDDGRKVRKELGDLGVRVIRVGTVLEQMLFDKERIVVQAGKPVEIVFENTDTMPHNLVFIQAGSLEEIGNLAETTALQPGAMERHYVPPSGKVLKASELVQPRQTQRFSFTPPKKAGVYPYVCTYPGHWRRMHGALYVVDDLEQYQENPEGYLAKNKLPIADELLKFNRPRKEWKFDDLAPFAKTLSGRTFATGKQMFTVAACVSCHKMGGVGQEFGPDLTKLDPKWKPADVLQHILEPSLKIDDKYRTWTFELNSGKQVTGMILEETKSVVKVIENPLVAAKPIEIKVANIDSRRKSEVSIMPKGLLDKLTKEEILDLLGYVVAGGDAKNKVFQGGHDHSHEHRH